MQASHGGYLKVRTFDHFDGLSWSSANEDISRKVLAGPSGKIRLQDDKAGNFQHIIEIEAPLPARLPVAADPASGLESLAEQVQQVFYYQQPLDRGRLQTTLTALLNTL